MKNQIKYISKDNLEKYTELVKSELNGKIAEPIFDGGAGSVLATDGNGFRYWTRIEDPQECTEEEINAIFNI